MQRTLVLIKPDAVEKGVWPEIIKMYEKHGLTIAATRILSPMQLGYASKLYEEHCGKSFYRGLVDFMTNGTTIALMIVGDNVVALVRAINGATKPSEAVKGTIRASYGSDGPANAVHGSATSADAEREIGLIFD